MDQYIPLYRDQLFIEMFPDQFSEGQNHIERLLDMHSDPALVPNSANRGPSIRSLGPKRIIGENKYYLNRYLRERGDPNIRDITDLINKANYFTDIKPGTDFISFKVQLEGINAAETLDLAHLFQDRMAHKTVFLQCMARHQLDAVAYPSRIHVAHKMGNPSEPPRYNSPNHHSVWGIIDRDGGFPTMNVPDGQLVGPLPARLSVSITFAGCHYEEGTLLKIASAFEVATRHRIPPNDFGPLPD